MAVVTNVTKWLAETKITPPAAMFSGQLDLFFVGGPVERQDYHLEEGEEFFYILQGELLLKVVERGAVRDVMLREGDLFLLPARVEHNPTRFEGTVAAVCERQRREGELDCARYYLKDSLVPQFERWFKLNNPIVDIPPVLKIFPSSTSFAENRITDESFVREAPYKSDGQVEIDAPIKLHEFIKSNENKLRIAPVTVFGAPKYSSSVVLYGEGTHALASDPKAELVLWTITGGKAAIDVDHKVFNLGPNDMARVEKGKSVSLTVSDGVVLALRMPGKQQ